MRMRAIDGWRGITALIVVIFHMTLTYDLDRYGGFLSSTFWLSTEPVLDFFFVCSGFVISLIYSERLDTRAATLKFLFLRAARFWPMHLTVLAALVALETFRLGLWKAGVLEAFSGPFAGPGAVKTLLIQAALVQAWAPDVFLNWNYPTWTLSAELVAYIGFALMCALPTKGWRIALCVAVVAVSTYAYYLQTDAWAVVNKPSLFRALAGFFLGYLTQVAWKRWPIRSNQTAAILEVFTTVGFVGLMITGATGLLYPASPLIFALMVYTFASAKGPLSSILSSKPLVWIGDRSYSIYLLHAVAIEATILAIRALGKLTDAPLRIAETYGRIEGITTAWQADLFAVAQFGVILVLAHFLYHLVETPVRDAASSYASKRFKSPTESAAAINRSGQAA